MLLLPAEGDTFGAGALLEGRPPSLLFCRRTLFFCGKAPTIGTACGSGRPAGSSFGGKGACQDVGKFGQGDLPVAQLGPLLGGGYRDYPGDEPPCEPRDQYHALVVRKRRRVLDVPREFDAAVRGVDVLAARAGRAGEPPAEFRRGNCERGRHLQIHATSVAQAGRDRSLDVGLPGPMRLAGDAELAFVVRQGQETDWSFWL